MKAMSKRNPLFVLLASIQLLGIILTVARGHLHLYGIVWLAIVAGNLLLAFIASIVTTNLFTDVYPRKKRSE
jgi:hypothetical protein